MDRNNINNFLKWQWYRYFSRKTLELNIFLFFMCMIFLFPLRGISGIYLYPVSLYCLPHLFSDIYFQLGFFASAIYFFSDVPFLNEWEMNRIIRMGRIKWGLSHIETIIVKSYLLMLNFWILTLVPVIGVLEWKKDWGKLLYTIAALGENELPFGIAYEILHKYTPCKAMILCIGIGGAVISFLGLFMFTVSLWFGRMAALTSTTIMVAFSLVAENLVNVNNLKFWYFSPISWVRIEYIEWEFQRGLPGITYIFTALVSMILICSVFIIFKVKRADFNWNRE